MPGERFSRAVGGYDPAEVEAAIAERDERLARIEREAQRLAERIVEREQKLQEALDKGPVSRGVEEIYGQARRQATRIRMKALEDAVDIADRVMELTRVRDDLRGRVNGIADAAKERLGGDATFARQVAADTGGGEGDRRPIGTESAAGLVDGVYTGTVSIDVGPLRDFAQLTGFEDAVGRIEGVSAPRVARFSDGRATIVVELGAPLELASELQSHAPFGVIIREAGPDGLVLDVAGAPGDQQRAA